MLKSLKEKKEPIRMCCACRSRKPKSQLIRLVKTANPKNPASEYQIKIDASSKADGRGAYLCKDSACIQKASKKKSLNRAFSCNVSNEIYALLQTAVSNGKF